MTEKQHLIRKLETRLELLHFALSNARDAERAFKLLRALEATQAELDELQS